MNGSEQVQRRLTARQEQAALLVALGQLKDAEIAEQTGTAYGTLRRWRGWPEFIERVEALRQAFARSVEGRGIADKQARVQKLQDLVDRMDLIVEGRAEDLADAPGGASGLLVRQYKQVGKDDFREEYVFDAALVTQIRATMQQAAQELGQWVERHKVSGKIRVEDLDAAIERELARLAGGGEAAAVGETPGA